MAAAETAQARARAAEMMVKRAAAAAAAAAASVADDGEGGGGYAPLNPALPAPKHVLLARQEARWGGFECFYFLCDSIQ